MYSNKLEDESIDSVARSKKTGHCLIEQSVWGCFGLLYAVGVFLNGFSCESKTIVLSFALKLYQLH